MANKIKENLNSTNQEAVVEEIEAVVEVDILAPNPNDTPVLAAYKRHLQAYKLQNPVKFESKKSAFIEKINAQQEQGEITMEEIKGQNGKLVRRTFKVPSIQKTKKK